jgi:hypothetical protein
MTGARRARSPNSLAASIVGLVGEFQVPVPTSAVRVLLADRGRPVTAEHLSRVAAYEKEDFLRTRMPPRLCSAIDREGRLVSPRWWAIGDWRLQRRILTEDAKPMWHAMLAERLCAHLGERDQPTSTDLNNLAYWALARLGLERKFGPTSRPEWLRLRDVVAREYPVVTHSLDSPTQAQHETETALLSADVPSVDLYFGRR